MSQNNVVLLYLNSRCCVTTTILLTDFMKTINIIPNIIVTFILLGSRAAIQSLLHTGRKAISKSNAGVYYNLNYNNLDYIKSIRPGLAPISVRQCTSSFKTQHLPQINAPKRSRTSDRKLLTNNIISVIIIQIIMKRVNTACLHSEVRVMSKSFIGRAGELKMLDQMWSSSKAELVILYGRRRIGKTRLLTHWMKAHQGEGLYWMAEPSSAVDQLRSFSQALANFADPEIQHRRISPMPHGNRPSSKLP